MGQDWDILRFTLGRCALFVSRISTYREPLKHGLEEVTYSREMGSAKFQLGTNNRLLAMK